MNQKFTDALKIISKKMENKNISWILIGSTSLALQGVNLEPEDIDILTDKEGVFEINKILKQYEIQSIKTNPSKLFKSHLSQYLINDVKVEVMGDFIFRSKLTNEWLSLDSMLQSYYLIETQKAKIPIFSLEKSVKIYEQWGREKDLIKIQMIRKTLNIKR